MHDGEAVERSGAGPGRIVTGRRGLLSCTEWPVCGLCQFLNVNLN